MLIDCNRCTMRDIACADCVVTHFLALDSVAPPAALERREEQALAVLHGAGLVPPLRMQGEARATG